MVSYFFPLSLMLCVEELLKLNSTLFPKLKEELINSVECKFKDNIMIPARKPYINDNSR